MRGLIWVFGLLVIALQFPQSLHEGPLGRWSLLAATLGWVLVGVGMVVTTIFQRLLNGVKVAKARAAMARRGVPLGGDDAHDDA